MVSYYGPAEASVCACVPFEAGQNPLPGLLYFRAVKAEAGMRETRHSYAAGASVLEAEPAVYETVQKLLLSYAGRERALIELHMEMAGDYSLVREIALCEQVMDNPALLLREDFSPLAWHGFSETDSFAELRTIDRSWLLNLLEVQGITKLEAEDGRRHRWLVGFLRHKGEKSRFLFVQEVRRFEAKSDSDMMRKLCSVLSNTMQENGSGTGALQNRRRRKEQVIGSLLYGKPHHPQTVRKLLYELGFEKREKYYLLAVERNERSDEKELFSELRAFLGREIYSHENYYVSILDSEKEIEYSNLDFPKLNAFCTERQLYAGLSYGFFDITSLSEALRQASAAIRIVKQYHWNRYFGLYSDMLITDMVDFCVKNGKGTLRNYCHPTVLRILDYDREYGTDFMSFLDVYLLSGMSVRKTADALVLHKNTVYQKLEKLKDYFGIDFEDVYLMIKLYVSIVALTLNEELDPGLFYLWS